MTLTASGTEVPARNVFGVINNTLNLVDPRLVNHGWRVAELIYRALVKRGGLSDNQKRDLCLLAMIHDIGAYKTEEIDRLLHFETVRVWEHSIYGYLFVKNMPPLAHLAPIVFFHHAVCDELVHVDESYHELAMLFHVADRIDIMGDSLGSLDRETYQRYFRKQRDIKYHGAAIDLFDAALFDRDMPDASVMYGDHPACTSTGDMHGFATFTEKEAYTYLETLVHSIDFRSPQTVTHTVGVAAIAGALADCLGLDRETMREIHLGAILHDLGKQGIPPEILEADRRLEPHEMDVMRTHVKLTEEVLLGHVSPNVMNIAIRHHERMDGAGYHQGLTADDLTVPERLVAVADIMSALLNKRSYKEAFPREKVLSILDTMQKNGHLDPDIVGLAAANIDGILPVMDIVNGDTFAMYDSINCEYERLLSLSHDFGRGEYQVIPDVLVWERA